MARKIGFSRRRIGVILVGIILIIFLGNVVLTGGKSLFLANPFGDDFNFVDVQSTFKLLDISGENIRVTDFIFPDPNGQLTYLCTLKIKTQVTFDDGGKIFLNSPAQSFSPLFAPFDVSTRAGRDITLFTSEPRMTCDVLFAKDDPKTTQVDESKLGVLGQGRLPYEVTTTNFFMSIDAYDENGQRKTIKGGVPLKLTGTGDQGEPIVFRDDPSITDPVKVFEGCLTNCGLFIGNERIIGKNVKVTEQEIENVLRPTKDFETRIVFQLGGVIHIEIPYLSDKLNDTFIVNIPIDQLTVRNSMDLEIDIDQPVTVVGTNLSTKITSINLGLSGNNGVLKTDGSTSSELIRVFISVNNWTEQEGKPTCSAISSRTVQPIFTVSSITAQEESLARGSDGVNSFFECRLRMPNNAPLGEYEIRAGTEATNRAEATSTIEVVRDGSGQCSEGQVRNILGQCVTEFGGSCPNGEFRTTTGDCVPEGTKACFDCLDRQIRTVGLEEMCPDFSQQCPDKETELIICTDGKPATKLVSGFTCNRDIDKVLSFLPTLVDCEAENRTADPDKGEICVPSWVIFLVENIVLVLIGLIILIIFIAILGTIIKSSPAGRIAGGFR